jgi:hypothetical protein
MRAPMANAQPWSRRVLSICPVGIAVLWVAGVSRFRGHDLTGPEWSAVVAGAFALTAMSSLAGRRRPLPKLPEGSNPVAISMLAAAILAVIAAAVAAVFEAIVDHYHPSEVNLAWRATWHAACAFAATYCAFLHRLGDGARPAGKNA